MKLLVVSGGRHPYEESTPILEAFLKGAGHDVTVTDDPSVLADSGAMGGYDALVFNTLRAGDTTLTESEQNGMKDFISGGKGFVCVHISGVVPETWQGYLEITGGGWVMGTSYLPPYGSVAVTVTQPGHPGVAGVSDFDTSDELYMGIDYQDGNDVYMTGKSEDGTWPWGGKTPSWQAERSPWAGLEPMATARCLSPCWATTARATSHLNSKRSF